MSSRGDEGETLADKLDTIRKSIPPLEGRRARLAHVSWEDFAGLVDVKPATVHSWRRGDAFPEEGNRVRLAELSGGRYQPNDFRKPTEEERAEEIRDLREELAMLWEAVDRIQPGLRLQLHEQGRR